MEQVTQPMQDDNKIIIIRTYNPDTCEVDEDIVVPFRIATMSKTIDNLIIDLGITDEPIPLQSVTAQHYNSIVKYCTKHIDDEEEDSEDEYGIPEPLKKKKGDDKTWLCDWDQDFFMEYDDTTVHKAYSFMTAVNYLDIPKLLDACARFIAQKYQNKTVEEMRELMGITDTGFTPEEEENIRKENEWINNI